MALPFFVLKAPEVVSKQRFWRIYPSLRYHEYSVLLLYEILTREQRDLSTWICPKPGQLSAAEESTSHQELHSHCYSALLFNSKSTVICDMYFSCSVLKDILMCCWVGNTFFKSTQMLESYFFRIAATWEHLFLGKRTIQKLLNHLNALRGL